MSVMKKASNFSAEEEAVLVQCVHNFRDVIECRRTDGETSKHKREAWERVERIFNSNVKTTARSASSLREKYKNLKKRLRKELAERKLYVSETGDGPPATETPLSETQVSLLALMGEEKPIGMKSSYDSDAIYLDYSHHVAEEESDSEDDAEVEEYEPAERPGARNMSKIRDLVSNWAKTEAETSKVHSRKLALINMRMEYERKILEVQLHNAQEQQKHDRELRSLQKTHAIEQHLATLERIKNAKT